MLRAVLWYVLGNTYAYLFASLWFGGLALVVCLRAHVIWEPKFEQKLKLLKVHGRELTISICHQRCSLAGQERICLYTILTTWLGSWGVLVGMVYIMWHDR
mmetsp:Transcript_40904/g.65717  ORF Transcript_40904/g.65717 Transcript_40904/m.65717 type:complete len:101 (-) Transcript_40904:3419-3721(-)